MTAAQFREALDKEGIEILDFWMKEVIDIGGERIFGRVNDDNSKDSQASLSGVLAARLVWTFSRAFSWYGHGRYLEYAEFCYSYLIDCFWDHKEGGIFWEVSPEGDVIDTRKQMYVQAFAVYALSEFCTATKFDEALEKSFELFSLIEKHGRDNVYGGYIEACARNWKPAPELLLSDKEKGSRKTMNTHLHLMEAYANLLHSAHTAGDFDKTEAVRPVLKSITAFILDTIYDPEKKHLDLYFTGDWQVTRREYSPGHDIEAAWLLNETAHILNETAAGEADKSLKDITRRVRETALVLTDQTLKTGMRKDGSLITDYPAEEEYTGYISASRLSEWWPQAEAWTGFLDAYVRTKDPKYLTAAESAFTWGIENLKDKTGGEWRFGFTRDGTPIDGGKASFWKCPYHSWRGCNEGSKRLSGLP